MSHESISKILNVRYLVIIALLGLMNIPMNAQKVQSMIGVRGNIETLELSAKFSMDKHNYLEGSIGKVTPQPEYTIGAGAAYHRHIHLKRNETLQFYYGAGIKGVLGDESGIGIGPQIGILALYKKINIGVDFLPTYFFNDVLEFRPLFGVHLRYVSY